MSNNEMKRRKEFDVFMDMMNISICEFDVFMDMMNISSEFDVFMDMINI